MRGGVGAAAAPRGGGDGGGRAALRGADLGGRHDRPRRGLVLAPALDGVALPGPPQPPTPPLGSPRARGAEALARLHRALRLLRRAQAPLLRLPTVPGEAPGERIPRGRRRRRRSRRGPRRRQVSACFCYGWRVRRVGGRWRKCGICPYGWGVSVGCNACFGPELS